MKHPPRSPKEPIIDRDMAIGIGVIGLVDALAILTVFALALDRYPGHLAAAQTIAFVTLCSSELIRAFTARSEYHSVLSIGVFSNRWMVWAVGVSFVLVLMVVYVPFLRPFFDTVPLTWDDWLFMLPFFFASPIAMELLKFYFRYRTARAARPVQAPAPVQPQARHSHVRNAMKKVLIPVDNSGHCLVAVKQVINEFMKDTAMEIHLLNVQAPFSRDVSQFVSQHDRNEYHHGEARKSLRPIEEMLEKFGIPFASHEVVGYRAKAITDAAQRLHCDLIVMGTARKNTLTRLVEHSVTNDVLERTTVPVELVAGNKMSKWERYGIPAAIASALALVVAVED
jgi:Ca2+-transporting ATPase